MLNKGKFYVGRTLLVALLSVIFFFCITCSTLKPENSISLAIDFCLFPFSKHWGTWRSMYVPFYVVSSEYALLFQYDASATSDSGLTVFAAKSEVVLVYGKF